MAKELPVGAYLAALLSGIPGLIAFLRQSSWTGLLLSAASLLCIGVAIVGYRRRQKPGDRTASILLALYGFFLGVWSYVAWVLILVF